MKLREEIKLIKTERKDLLSFAYLVGGIFIAIGLLVFRKHHNLLNIPFLIGSLLVLGGLLAPMALKPVYIVWMTFGLIMSRVMAPVLFSLVYFLTFIPIGVLSRLFGKKFLDLEFKKPVDSYWIAKLKKENQKQSVENQF